MDLSQRLLEDHRHLRASLACVTAMLDKPCNSGWEDRQSLDAALLSRNAARLFADFKSHEEFEQRILLPLVRRMADGGFLAKSVDDSHRGIEQITRLFEAVCELCDGEHVYRVRSVLLRLQDELESHLDFEEQRLFPRLGVLATNAS